MLKIFNFLRLKMQFFLRVMHHIFLDRFPRRCAIIARNCSRSSERGFIYIFQSISPRFKVKRRRCGSAAKSVPHSSLISRFIFSATILDFPRSVFPIFPGGVDAEFELEFIRGRAYIARGCGEATFIIPGLPATFEVINHVTVIRTPRRGDGYFCETSGRVSIEQMQLSPPRRNLPSFFRSYFCSWGRKFGDAHEALEGVSSMLIEGVYVIYVYYKVYYKLCAIYMQINLYDFVGVFRKNGLEIFFLGILSSKI